MVRKIVSIVWRKRTALIATPFALLMTGMMAYLTLHLDHLRTMNEVYLNLQKEDESFMQEVELILDLKCRLLNDDLPEGYYLNGYYVDIIQTGADLTATYAGKTYRIQTVDDELYDYAVID